MDAQYTEWCCVVEVEAQRWKKVLTPAPSCPFMVAAVVFCNCRGTVDFVAIA